jgi:hypothetical protein
MNFPQSDSPKIVDDNGIAVVLGCSVWLVRKDRRTDRRIPFFRIARLIRYDVDAVRAAMLARQEGGAK